MSTIGRLEIFMVASSPLPAEPRFYVANFTAIPGSYREVCKHGLPRPVLAEGSFDACAAAMRLLLSGPVQ